jgi:hypothetical protein
LSKREITSASISFFKVHVLQGRMAGCSAREAKELVLALYVKIEDSQRGGQMGYLGEGDCFINKDEITNMKCNLNNDIKSIYLSMMKYV